jgi:hypothetical protein
MDQNAQPVVRVNHEPGSRATAVNRGRTNVFSSSNLDFEAAPNVSNNSAGRERFRPEPRRRALSFKWDCHERREIAASKTQRRKSWRKCRPEKSGYRCRECQFADSFQLRVFGRSNPFKGLALVGPP